MASFLPEVIHLAFSLQNASVQSIASIRAEISRSLILEFLRPRFFPSLIPALA